MVLIGKRLCAGAVMKVPVASCVVLSLERVSVGEMLTAQFL